MSLPLVFQAGVRAEIDEAYTWYEEQRKGLGEEFLAELESVLGRIERHPEHYALVHLVLRRGRLKRFPYFVFYRIDAHRIAIVAVHHSKRDPGRWQSRA